MRTSKPPDFTDLDLNIARARIVLSLVTLVSVYFDPTTTGGAFSIDGPGAAVLGAHLAYGVVIYVARGRRLDVPASACTALDLLFAIAVALVTEGPTSASYVFFAFAIIAVGCRAGFRETLAVTFASVLLYLALIVLSARGGSGLYVMRPAYLAITGYLIAFLGQRRLAFEQRTGELEAAAERHEIARALHDGYVQALASMNLRLDTCRQLLARERAGEARAEIEALQRGVLRQYDETRAYVRLLAGIEQDAEARPPVGRCSSAIVRLRADVAASGPVVEHVLHIVLEGIRNASRHGRASTAAIQASGSDRSIRITMDDDGVGFGASQKPPWSIASRVAELGGRLSIAADDRAGAHLEIEMPLPGAHEDADSLDHRR